MNKEILNIALPAIVSNVTVPLLGLVDVAIVGHLGAAEYIGAIAVGSMLFNCIYWLFGFLRMSTSGLTAQAFGESRKDFGNPLSDNLQSTIENQNADNRQSRKENREFDVLRQALFLAFAAAGAILLLQWPLRESLLFLMNAEGDVRAFASRYFDICVWGAPAVLGFFALNGWFIGMQDSRTPMKIAIGQNIFNICLSTFFVFTLGMKVEGVALGTLLSQWGAFLVAWNASGFHGIGGLRAKGLGARLLGLSVSPQAFFSRILGFSGSRGLGAFLKVSRDIFLRTLCLMSVTFFFTSAGARQGTLTLAVNTLLMQLFLLYSYFSDGFAYAGEALAGKYYGARNNQGLRLCIRRLFLWGGAVAALFTLLYGFAIDPILSLLTDDEAVLSASADYALWAAVIPVAGIAAFIWDGVFIGMTLTRGMLLTCALATAVFYAVFHLLFPAMGNHALWLAYLLFLLLRGSSQTLWFHLKRPVELKINQ